MKPLLLALAAVSLVAALADTSNAQLFGRRRGGGGGMGNASQLCDMSKVSQVVPPSACAGGSCNAQVDPAPAAPLAPPAEVAPAGLTRRTPRKHARGRHSFDLPTEPPVAIASR
jgi:hypothetical protein